MRKSLHKDCGSQFKDSGQSDTVVLKVVWANKINMLVHLFLPWVNTLYWHHHKIELVGDLKIILIVLSAGKDVKIWAGCQKALQSGRGTYHNTELSVIAHGM